MNLDIYHLNKEERAEQIAGALETALVDNALTLTIDGGKLYAVDFIRGDFHELKISGNGIETITVEAIK